MSWRLMDRTCDFRLPCDQERVLLRMARHASDDGTNCYASVATIADEADRSRRAVQRALRDLETGGYLVCIAHRHGGRGMATEYLLPFAKDDTYTALSFKRASSLSQKGVISDAERASNPALKGGLHDAPIRPETVIRNGQETVIYPAEPSEPAEKPKRVKDDRATDVQAVFAYYKARIQPNAKLCPADKIRTRLKTFSVDELTAGIDHFAADAWWMEHNARRGADWFFKSDTRSEQFLNLIPRKESTNGPTRNGANGRPAGAGPGRRPAGAGTGAARAAPPIDISARDPREVASLRKRGLL